MISEKIERGKAQPTFSSENCRWKYSCRVDIRVQFLLRLLLLPVSYRRLIVLYRFFLGVELSFKFLGSGLAANVRKQQQQRHHQHGEPQFGNSVSGWNRFCLILLSCYCYFVALSSRALSLLGEIGVLSRII